MDSVPGSTSVARGTVNFLTRSQRVRRAIYVERDMSAMGWMARECGRRAWFPHFLPLSLVSVGAESSGWPSLAAIASTDVGTGCFHSKSPIRWSSQILELKKSMPGGCLARGVLVKALRCERRNMFDLPTIHGATATAEIAV